MMGLNNVWLAIHKILNKGGLMDKQQYYKYYYAIHADRYKKANRQYRKKKRLQGLEPEQTQEERKKSIAEWIEYMDRKY